MRSVESLSLSILRLAEEHAMKENTGQVLVQAPTEIANYLLNEKRRALSEIEKRHDAPIVIVAEGGDAEDPAFANARRVVLERMTDEDIGALIDARLPLVPALRSRIVTLANGRPDTAARCLTDLVARDVLVPTAQGCALRVEVPLAGEPRSSA